MHEENLPPPLHSPLIRSMSNDSVSTQSSPPPYSDEWPRPFPQSIWASIRQRFRDITDRLPRQPAISLGRVRASRATQFRGDASLPDIRDTEALSPMSLTQRFQLPFRRIDLPPRLARYRDVFLCISALFILLFSFLLFCTVYFAPSELPPTVFPDKSSDRAQLLTLNIFMRPPLIKNNLSDYKDERLDYIIRHLLPKYDFIAFQESFAFASHRKDKLIKEARAIGFNHHVESPRRYPWDLSIDGGLLFLSRFPIIRSDIITFPRGTHSDWLAQKGALHAIVALNATRHFHVYTTHTQASYDQNNVINQGDTMIRLEQFAKVHEFIHDTAKDDNLPIIIMGDLNVDAAVHGPNIPVTRPSVASSHEYKMMVDVLTGRGVDPKELDLSSSERLFHHPWKLDLADVVYNAYGYHPVTFGDINVTPSGTVHPAETILTQHDQLMTVQSIDRVFLSERGQSPLQVNKPTVEKCMIKDDPTLGKEEREQLDFTQLSDHYGVSFWVS